MLQWFLSFSEFAEFTEMLFYLGKTRMSLYLFWVTFFKRNVQNWHPHKNYFKYLQWSLIVVWTDKICLKYPHFASIIYSYRVIVKFTLFLKFLCVVKILFSFIAISYSIEDKASALFSLWNYSIKQSGSICVLDLDQHYHRDRLYIHRYWHSNRVRDCFSM